MLFERVVIRLLNESRLRDAMKKYPNVDVHELANHDPSGFKHKYIMWMAKQVSAGELHDDVISTAMMFDKFQSKLSKRSIMQYDSLAELQTALDAAGTSTRQQRLQAKQGAQRIGANDEYDLFRMDTKEAAIVYGKGTRWCISSPSRLEWEQYAEGNGLFYFAIRHESIGDDNDKIAIHIERDDDNALESYTAFDAADMVLDVPNDDPLVELIELAGDDASSRPATKIVDFSAGKFDVLSDDELIELFPRLTDDMQTIIIDVMRDAGRARSSKAREIKARLAGLAEKLVDMDISGSAHRMLLDILG